MPRAPVTHCLPGCCLRCLFVMWYCSGAERLTEPFMLEVRDGSAEILGGNRLGILVDVQTGRQSHDGWGLLVAAACDPTSCHHPAASGTLLTVEIHDFHVLSSSLPLCKMALIQSTMSAREFKFWTFNKQRWKYRTLEGRGYWTHPFSLSSPDGWVYSPGSLHRRNCSTATPCNYYSSAGKGTAQNTVLLLSEVRLEFSFPCQVVFQLKKKLIN